MKDSNKTVALRKLLEQQGDKPEKIEATLDLIRANEQNKKIESMRSWLALAISGIALVVSIFVAIFK